MILAKHFYMIRHGETEANAARILAGHLDTPLTERGQQQARETLPIIRSLNTKPQTIVHSHLSRARDTAQILNRELNLPMHEDPDIAEHYAGKWEGKPYDECQDILVDWVDPPDGEKFEDFFERVKRGKNSALKRYPGPVLIVCHGGLFRAFGKLYGIDTYGVKNCHLYEFEPAPHKDGFPWTVWQYDLVNDKIERTLSPVYEGDPEAAIAS